jgi:streptogramin lyase
MTGVVRLVSRNGAKNGVVNIYALGNGSNPADIVLKPDKPMKIDFIGEETTQAMGKTQVVKKYQWGSRELLVTTQGLVLSMGSDQIVYAISGYKEYEPWGAIR